MKVAVPYTIDEFGEDCLYIELTIMVDVTFGEPKVMYYPDGSGYPGSPDEAEISGIIIEECFDLDDNDVEVSEALETAVEEFLDDNPDLWYEEALDYAQDPY